jgi:hypothetical protein
VATELKVTDDFGGLIMDFDLTYYLSGPMAGYADHNFPFFARTAAFLRQSGIKIVSPHEVHHQDYTREVRADGSYPTQEQSWHRYLETDLVVMLTQTDGIIMLKGWPESRGARLELDVALQLGRPVFYYSEPDSTISRMSKNGFAE